MRADHDDHAQNIALIRRLTHDMTPPDHACGSWRSLYGGTAALLEIWQPISRWKMTFCSPGLNSRHDERGHICLAALHGGEIAPDYFAPLAVEPQQSVDVARWRKAERLGLGALRDGLGLGGRNEVSAQIRGHLAKLLPTLGLRTGSVLSGYWPIKGEPDLRPFWQTCTVRA